MCSTKKSNAFFVKVMQTYKKPTHHGKSSKIGLVLVLKTAMIAGRSAACGSPERTGKADERVRLEIKIMNTKQGEQQ